LKMDHRDKPVSVHDDACSLANKRLLTVQLPSQATMIPAATHPKAVKVLRIRSLRMF